MILIIVQDDTSFMRLRLRFCLLCLLGAGWLVTAPSAWAKGQVFKPCRAPFSVSCHDLVFNYRLQTLFILPGDALRFSVLDADPRNDYDVRANTGTVRALGCREWRWTPGLGANGTGEVILTRQGIAESVRLQAIALVPYGELHDGRLHGYEIGDYPPAEESPEYGKPPRGFIEVREDNADLAISPHFTLRQFVCPQVSDFPKYLVLDERLPIKLEALLEAVNNQGHPCENLVISCGYRTPAYNRRRGHARFSAHQWGQAADVIVDGQGRGRMDDLNHDGKINGRDAKVVYDIIDSLDGTPRYQDMVGGLGLYEGNGAFVHVDVRGSRARWAEAAPQPKNSKRHL
jgi:hypothetical protein